MDDSEGITLRRPEDCGTAVADLFDLYKRSLGPLIEMAFGWDEAVQRNRFESMYRSDDVSMILCEFAVAGYIEVQATASDLCVSLLLIEPQFQRRGIGRNVLKRIHARAIACGSSVSLSVMRRNTSALAFYKALGYSVVAEEPELLDLRLIPKPD
jgi:ribosomal protein S18 acetylase RimI-like enzyme